MAAAVALVLAAAAALWIWMSSDLVRSGGTGATVGGVAEVTPTVQAATGDSTSEPEPTAGSPTNVPSATSSPFYSDPLAIVEIAWSGVDGTIELSGPEHAAADMYAGSWPGWDLEAYASDELRNALVDDCLRRGNQERFDVGPGSYIATTVGRFGQSPVQTFRFDLQLAAGQVYRICHYADEGSGDFLVVYPFLDDWVVEYASLAGS